MAGTGLGPVRTPEMAAALAAEANERTQVLISKWKSELHASTRSPPTTMLTNGVDVSFMPGRIG